jgi:hypothetical protein
MGMAYEVSRKAQAVILREPSGSLISNTAGNDSLSNNSVSGPNKDIQLAIYEGIEPNSTVEDTTLAASSSRPSSRYGNDFSSTDRYMVFWREEEKST